MTNKNWTRDEEIIVFNLYCKIPFQKSSKNHPEVIKIANLIGRTPSAVNMKIGNFGSFDPNLKAKGISGLTNSSKLDEQIWNEFNNNWDRLAYESEKLILKFSNANNQILESFPLGKDKIVQTKQRMNQSFFRNAILAAYNDSCCITGLCNKELLIASHIKPYKNSNPNEKANPHNGLCLNALHDKAFDKGFMTITTDFKIIISNEISDIFGGKSKDIFFKQYHNMPIKLPDKFMPNKLFLEYHNDMIFENWK